MSTERAASFQTSESAKTVIATTGMKTTDQIKILSLPHHHPATDLIQLLNLLHRPLATDLIRLLSLLHPHPATGLIRLLSLPRRHPATGLIQVLNQAPSHLATGQRTTQVQQEAIREQQPHRMHKRQQQQPIFAELTAVPARISTTSLPFHQPLAMAAPTLTLGTLTLLPGAWKSVPNAKHCKFPFSQDRSRFNHCRIRLKAHSSMASEEAKWRKTLLTSRPRI